jgi:hypothetical protein
MARFLIRSSNAPLSEATASALTIRTAASNRRMARIVESFTSPTTSTTVVEDIQIASSAMVDLFEAGHYVRIVRPSRKDQPLDRVFEVHAKDRNGPHLDLKGFNGAVKFQPEDVGRSGDRARLRCSADGA